MTGRVVVVGDLVTDILAILEDTLAPGSDTRARIRVTGGGQAANTAAWLAWQRVPVTLVAAAGEDEAGRVRADELAAGGVQCAIRHHPGTRTGSVVVLAGDGERTMINDRGANLLLRPEDVDAALAGAPDAVHLHLSGYTLLDEESRPAGLHALRAARERGLTVSVDAASARPLRQVGAAAFLDWVRGIDLLLANRDEAAVLDGPGFTQAAKSTVVKLGPDGATWTCPDSPTVRVPADRRPVVDSTGAGDAFAAGLIAAWLSGADPESAMRAGARLGAIAVCLPGARPGDPPDQLDNGRPAR
jgi:sugar/nucleoside kinase (ribokinase family)